MRETTLTAPPRTWSRSFPATSEQVGEARRFLASLLADHPAASDAITCLSELATNSTPHSRSARPGGTFSVRMHRSGPAIRIEVTDDGGVWLGRPHDPEHGRGLQEHGHGLQVVEALSSRRGIITEGPATEPTKRTVWFELPVP